jgi:hypothetical protein
MKGVNVAFLLVGLLVVIVEGGSPRFDKTDHDKQINNKRERQGRFDRKQLGIHSCLGGRGNGKKKSHLFKQQKKCLQRLSHGPITEKLINCQCSLLGELSNTYDNRKCMLLAPNEFVPGMDVNSGGEINFKKKYKKYERRFQMCLKIGPYKKKTQKKTHSTFLEVASGFRVKTAKELSWGEVQGECKGMAASEVFENIPEECPNGDKSVQFDCRNNAKLCECLVWVGQGHNVKFTSGNDYLTLAKENDEITYSISCSDEGDRRRRLLQGGGVGNC